MSLPITETIKTDVHQISSTNKPSTEIVACLGASYTEAKGSYRWIDELENRPRNANYHFLNFGVGGDLAYCALQRLDQVVAAHPDRVIILLGTNDVMTQVSKKMLWFLRRWKDIPQQPSAGWYRENMLAIVHRIQSETQAQIALCSIPPIGEDPTDAVPFQAEINRRVIELNAIVQQIASDEGSYYVPVYERMQEEILASPGKAMAGFHFLPLYGNAIDQYMFHKSLDEIGRRNGWVMHTDGIHLTSQGGRILVDLIQSYLDS